MFLYRAMSAVDFSILMGLFSVTSYLRLVITGFGWRFDGILINGRHWDKLFYVNINYFILSLRIAFLYLGLPVLKLYECRLKLCSFVPGYSFI